MAHKRTFQHEMESKSKEIFSTLIPSHWVIRAYDYPDYGIDLAIEVFDKIEDGSSITSGEHFFVQLKSSLVCTTSRIVVGQNLKSEIEVIKYTIKTKTLETAMKMGTASPLILVLICFESNKIYYLCLNDYLALCVPSYSGTEESKTIYIPTANELTPEQAFRRFRLYSTRAKLYSLFSLLEYQRSEIQYMTDGCQDMAARGYERERIKSFAREIHNRDIWNISHPWHGVQSLFQEFVNPITIYFETGKFVKTNSNLENMLEIMGEPGLFRIVWDQMCAFHGTFHELIRQRELPTEIEGFYTG